jgi:hypothetical protein
VIKDQLATQAHKAYRAYRVYKGNKVSLESKGTKAQLVIQVHKVLEDLLENKV